MASDKKNDEESQKVFIYIIQRKNSANLAIGFPGKYLHFILVAAAFVLTAVIWMNASYNIFEIQTYNHSFIHIYRLSLGTLGWGYAVNRFPWSEFGDW